MNNKIKDVYGKVVGKPKTYQNGGEIGQTQFDLSGVQNPLQQQLLTQLRGYGFEFDPTKLLAGQFSNMDFSAQAIADTIRSKFGIGHKVEMPKSIFTELTEMDFEGLQSETYDPLRDVKFAGFEDMALEEKSKINTGGFYGTGEAETKRADVREDVGKGVVSTEMDIDKIMSGEYSKILKQMQEWEAKGQKLRYG